MSNRKRIRTENVPLSDLVNAKSAHPVNPVFLEGLIAYSQSGGEGYETRTVTARKISIPTETPPTPEGLAMMRQVVQTNRRQYESPTAIPLAVLERPGGILQAWDDVHLIAAFHESAPLAQLRVVIIGYDPDPVVTA